MEARNHRSYYLSASQDNNTYEHDIPAGTYRPRIDKEIERSWSQLSDL